MPSSLFSTYATGENRVTSSILAVLERLSIDRISFLLGSLMEEPEFELVHFENQSAKGARGVPDAVITSNVRILLETKIVRNSVTADQIQRHIDRLVEATESARVLLLLTPDSTEPSAMAEAQCDPAARIQLIWASFAQLDQAIGDLLSKSERIISEREAFLLRELQRTLEEEKLLGLSADVVIVAARRAWHEYQQFSAYVCQPDRAFQPVSRLGFYSDGRIHPLIPKIMATNESVLFEPANDTSELATLIRSMVESGARERGRSYKVILLSGPNHSDTVHLSGPILNDLKSRKGRPTAYTQNQRYVALERLKTAKKTSQLFSD